MYDDEDSVRQYLHEIGRHPLLTAEEEVELARCVRAGQAAQAELADAGVPARLARADRERIEAAIAAGDDAEAALVRCNLRLVVSVAKRFAGRTDMGFQDLIQEGNLGLLRAVQRFDPELGFKFSTYAIWWIRQSISRAIVDQGSTIRMPYHVLDSYYRILRAQRSLAQELGREPTTEEVAVEVPFIEPEEERLAIRDALAEGRRLTGAQTRLLRQAVIKVERILRTAQVTLSLDMAMGDDEDSSLADFIEDRSEAPAVDAASRQLLQDQVQDILSKLSDREREVLELRFGLRDGVSRSLDEIAQTLGVSRERIRQIESRAVRKLRHPVYSRTLRDYYLA
jgi:RNA polymerase primary sigma factor